MYEYANGTRLDDESIDLMVERVAFLRAMHLWFHAAHHVVKGASYSGDHGILYDRIYTGIQAEVDGAIEKVIGLTGSERTACPKILASRALNILERYPSPVDLDPLQISQTGLRIERDYLDYVSGMFYDMEKRGILPLGLNDQLAASANNHENYVYLLQQRAR